MAKLNELLEYNESISIDNIAFIDVDTNKDVADLTIKELEQISTVLIQSEHGDTFKGYLTAECVRILFERAEAKNIPIF